MVEHCYYELHTLFKQIFYLKQKYYKYDNDERVTIYEF